MQVLRLKRKTESKIELATLLINAYCLVHKIKLNETEALILSYFMIYGFKKTTKDLIINSKILTYNSLANCITRLRRAKLVEMDPQGFTIMCKGLRGQVDNKMGIIIELINV